jgi:tetratricopeptide (TPR) repeat protein
MIRPFALFLILLSPAIAGASEKSNRLYSKAVVEFQNGRYAAAIDSADRAVAADPSDPYAVYYRGVIRGQQGDLEGAISDLRRSLALKPDLLEAKLDLGVALVQQGQYDEAVTLLEAARGQPDLEGNAALFLGVVQLRRGEPKESLSTFEEIAATYPELSVTATYYKGVAEERLGRNQAARRSFESVVAAKPDSEIGRQAAEFLARLAAGGGSRGPARRYRIYGGFGLDYDSNVVLETDGGDPAIFGGDDKEDVNGNLHVGGQYSLWRGENTALSAGYDLFQRLYVSLNEYNLQGHRPSLHLTGRWEKLRFGLINRYEFYLLETDAYTQRVETNPWVAFHAADWSRTEISYRFRWNDFFKSPPRTTTIIDSGSTDDVVVRIDKKALDSITHEPRIRQYFYVGGQGRHISISYAYERRDSTHSAGDVFSYNANEVEVGFGTPVVWEIDLYGSYSYRYEDYDENDRVDEPQRFIVVLRRPLTDWMSASVGYYGTLHNSDIPGPNSDLFQYDRHIVSVGFDFQY